MNAWTKSAAPLLNGALTLSTAHPLALLADQAIKAMITATASRSGNASHTTIVPFEIYTREDLSLSTGSATVAGLSWLTGKTKRR